MLRDGAVVGTLSGAEVTQDGVLGLIAAAAQRADGRIDRDADASGPSRRSEATTMSSAELAAGAALDRRATQVLDWIAERGVYVGLLLLIAFNLVFTPRFAEIDNIRLQFVQVVPVAIIALGMALVIGTRGIDLSVGSVMAIASALLALYLGLRTGRRHHDRARSAAPRSASSTAC